MVLLQKYHIPRWLIGLTVLITLLPATLNLLGVSFAVPVPPLDLSLLEDESQRKQFVILHELMKARFIHIILVTFSITVALLTIILAFIDFKIKNDVSTPIVATALFCAGIVDVFHLLATSRLIEFNYLQYNISPFTWVTSRMFHSFILVFGVSIFLFQNKKMKAEAAKRSTRFVSVISIGFIVLALLTVGILKVNTHLPQTIFPDQAIPRPYDLVPLVIYIFAAFYFLPAFYKKYPSVFSQALLLSLIPAVFTQLHMALGSSQIFDNHYFIANFLKGFTYFVPFLGLSLNYLQTHKNELKIVEALSVSVAEKEVAEQTLRAVFDSSPDMIMAFDVIEDRENNITDFSCKQMNRVASRSFRFNKNDEPYLLKDFPQQISTKIFKEAKEVYLTGQSSKFEHQFNDEETTICFYCIIMKREGGVTVTLADISHRKTYEKEILDSKRKIEAMFNQSLQVIGLLSIDGTILNLNEPAYKYLKIGKNELKDVKLWDQSVWNTNKKNLTLIKSEFERSVTGSTKRMEIEIKTYEIIYNLEISFNPIFGQTGFPHLILFEARDISEQIRANKKLQESQLLLNEAQKLAHLGSWEWDLQTNKIIWSDEMYRIYGYLPDEKEIDYRFFINHVHQEDKELVHEILFSSCETKESFTFQNRIVQKNGDIRILLTKGNIKTDNKKQAVKMICTSMDLTDQFETHEQIRKSEILYRTLAKNIPDSAVMLFDSTLTINLVEGNLKADDLFIKKEYLGKNLKEKFQKINKDYLAIYCEKALEGEETKTEFEIDGFIYKLQVLPVQNRNKEIFAGLIVLHDITELKRIQHELELRVTELNRSNVELEQFAYIASHDMQEPLRKIQAFADRLFTKYEIELGETGLNYLNKMQSASERMQNLINDLLVFSRVSRSKEEAEPVRINDLINEILSDLEILIVEKNAKIEVDTIPELYAIPRQIRQMFQNLISNALKFSKPDVAPDLKIKCDIVYNPKLTFSGSKPIRGKKHIKITVSDNGIGFDEKYLDRIFVIFQRLHGRNEYKGTGIGLAICKKVAENHNGFITAHSKEGEGSEFVIYLPVNQDINETSKRQTSHYSHS
jgi:signal transduction histidine kinase